MNEFNKKKNIVLAGFMGVGKTTIGLLLAKRMKRKFVDVDSLIEEKMQMKISKIFEEKGEGFFRKIESEIISELSEKEGVVIAIGGGAVLKKANISNLMKNGIVICLNASVEEISRRIGDKKDRPLIETQDKLQTLREIFSQRKALYEELPVKIETDGKSPEDVIEEILKAFDK
jgi:shikimate kinase